MGLCPSKSKALEDVYAYEKDPTYAMVQKIKHLQDENHVILQQREEEAAAYEKQLMNFMFREAHWKGQKKQLLRKVSRLKKKLKDKTHSRSRSLIEEDRLSGVEKVGAGQNKLIHEKQYMNNSSALALVPSTQTDVLVEQMRIEKATRDEAVRKWKMLYLAIKTELDDLIQITHQGGTLCLQTKEEQDMKEELQRELTAKDEMIRALKTQLISAEQEVYEKKREIDILRQSIRIMGSKGKGASPNNLLPAAS